MNVLDWLLVVLVLAYALSGYWQGFVTGAFATAGLLAGGLFGVWLAPVALGNADPSLLVSLGALFIVILSASLGQGLFPVRRRQAPRQDHLAARTCGRRDRRRCTVRRGGAGGRLGPRGGHLRLGDQRHHAGGAWLGGAGGGGRGAAAVGVDDAAGVQQRRRHHLLPALPRAVRARADHRGATRRQALLRDPDVTRASQSILKVRGANSCGRGVEGSGFLVAPDRLMTNAHVVAGVDDPEVEVGDDAVSATVVYYNPDLDIAVLAVDTGDRPALPLDKTVGAEAAVAIVG